MRSLVLLAFSLITGCGGGTGTQDDRMPFSAQSLPTDQSQEVGIQRAIAELARERELSLSQGHLPAEFGCSNTYRLQHRDGEIIVHNPFGFEYKVLAYASSEEGQAS
jgi:hypothetical protein